MTAVLGIDLGAGSLKATLVDERGETLGEASAPVATRRPQPGWSEQDPADWWRALCEAVPRALAQGGVPPTTSPPSASPPAPTSRCWRTRRGR